MKKGFFLILLILSACSSPVPTDFSYPIEAHFCPKEDCMEILTTEIDNTKVFIHCAFYDIDEELLKKILDKKIEIKIVAESDNINHSSETIKYDSKNSTMHNKFCIIDNKKVITGSLNPTIRGMQKNQNNFVIISSYYLAQNYEEEFQELWNGKFSGGKKILKPKIIHNNIEIESYFCPEDNCKDKILKEIMNAKKSVYFAVFSFTDEEIADALLYSDTQVTGILDKIQSYSKYSQYKRMKDFRLNVKIYNGSGFLHHKVFVIDSKTVIIGSFNPTWSGNNKNDENILIIRSERIAKKYIEEIRTIQRGR